MRTPGFLPLLSGLIAALLACPLGAADDAPTEDDRAGIEESLRLLVGHPDIKPGIEISKVAGLVWTRQHIVEAFDDDHLVASLVMQEGQAMLPYVVEFRFRDGALTGYSFMERDGPPDLFAAQRADRDDRPWPLIDRSVLGYAFRVSPGWRLIARRDLQGAGYTCELTVVGVTRVYDAALEEWVENSLQWCVYRRPKGFKSIKDVIAVEEKRLAASGTTVRERERQGDHTVVYRTTFRGNPYLGQTRFFIFDGRGYAVRFNATEGTYGQNLPRFERFVRDFRLTNQRPENPDMDLLRVGDNLVEIVGGAATAEELEGMTMETKIPGR